MTSQSDAQSETNGERIERRDSHAIGFVDELDGREHLLEIVHVAENVLVVIGGSGTGQQNRNPEDLVEAGLAVAAHVHGVLVDRVAHHGNTHQHLELHALLHTDVSLPAPLAVHHAQQTLTLVGVIL